MDEVESSQSEASHAPSRRNMPVVLGVIVAILLVLAVAGFFGYRAYKHNVFVNTVPVSIRQQVTFPIYLPNDSLTEVDTESISYSNSVFQYTGKVGNTAFVVSEQQKTNDFDITKFATSETLSGAQQNDIPVGTLLSATLNNRPLHIVDTGSTIITITGRQPGAANTLQPLSDSLEKL